MNQHIQALISQCPLRYNTHQSSETRQLELEKFAQLIIQETLGVVCDVRTNARAEFEISNRTDLDKFILNGSSAHMVDAVNEHFGIK